MQRQQVLQGVTTDGQVPCCKGMLIRVHVSVLRVSVNHASVDHASVSSVQAVERNDD